MSPLRGKNKVLTFPVWEAGKGKNTIVRWFYLKRKKKHKHGTGCVKIGLLIRSGQSTIYESHLLSS